MQLGFGAVRSLAKSGPSDYKNNCHKAAARKLR
jgi:hypothetical protein